MNKEDIYFIEKYEQLLNNGYCNCNEMNCLDNNSPRRILNIVKQLQQENKQLKEQLGMSYPLFNTSFKGKKLKFLSMEKCNNKCCFNYELEEENNNE